MTSILKNMLFTAAILIPAALTTATAQAQRGEETFRISNESSYRIDHVYMTRSSYQNWGSDVLYGYMQPNQYLDLTVDAGRYDVRVVDRDGDSCVISNVDVFEGEVWHLTDARLLACELVTR
jgi:hypothetical protein